MPLAKLLRYYWAVGKKIESINSNYYYAFAVLLVSIHRPWHIFRQVTTHLVAGRNAMQQTQNFLAVVVNYHLPHCDRETVLTAGKIQLTSLTVLRRPSNNAKNRHNRHTSFFLTHFTNIFTTIKQRFLESAQSG